MANGINGLGQNAIGIDVSYSQDYQVNWQQFRASGFSFAYIKATEGTGIFDVRFNNHWQGARAAGILRGSYHFFHPTLDPLVQAHNFTTSVGVGQSDLPPVLDIEGDGANAFLVNNMAANFDRVRIWLETVEGALNLKPVIYTGAGFWNQVINRLGGAAPGWLNGYRLWVANFVGSYTDGVTWPLMPSGWDNWTFWQFSSPGVWGVPDQIPAIAKSLDVDFYNGTEEQLRASIGADPGRPFVTKTPFHGTNQEVINVFFAAFGEPDYFDVKMVNAGLAQLAQNREAAYTGPAVEDLPNLSDADRQALLSVLVGAG